MTGAATFSSCGTYRYTLSRQLREPLGDTSIVNFVMLNPSPADAEQSDPTVTRCINFARAWGFDTLLVTNIFALRSTDPRALKRHADPIGHYNDAALTAAAGHAALVVAAWGTHGAQLSRGAAVEALMRGTKRPLHHLGLTKDGHPRHPLYIAYSQQPERWT